MRHRVFFVFWIIYALAPAGVLPLFGSGSAEAEQERTEDTRSAEERGAQTDELVVAAPGEPGNLDPCIGGSPITTSVVMAAYETPVTYETEDRQGYRAQVPNDVEGWRPGLAERIELSEDRQTITFHLRPGVEFYPSGNEMTAEDWIWSWRRQLSDPDIGFCKFQNAQASIFDIDQISAPDSYTVRVRLDEPNQLALPFMRFQMFSIYDSERVQTHATEDDPWATEWLTRNTAGTGPYHIDEWEQGRRVVLERNPNYHGEPPAYDRVVIDIVPEQSTRLSLLQRGDVDLVRDVAPSLADRISQSENVEQLSVDSGNRVYVGFNVQREPFDDLSLRQAIAYATPYDSIHNDIYEGKGRRYRSFVLPELEAYTAEGFPYEQDLERARELLAEAEQPQEQPTLVVNSANQLQVDAALLVQDALSRIGFDIAVERMPSGEFTSAIFEKELDFFVHSGVSWIDDPATITGLWMRSGAQGNFTGFSNETVDRLHEQWQYAEPSDERRSAYREIQRLYNEAVNVVYLVLADHIVLQRNEVEGYVYYKDRATRFQDLKPEDDH